MSSLTDYENAVTSFSSTNTVGRSSVKARWERKVLSQSSASGSTPADNGPNGPNGPNTPCSSSSSKKSYGDRFIPNRSGMTCLQGKLLDCGGGCAGGYGVATTAEESRSKSALPANEVSDDDDDGDGGGGKDRCATTAVQPYIAALAGALDLDVPLGGGAASDDNNSRILSFRDKAPLPRSDAAAADNLKVLYSQSIGGYCGTGRGGSNRSAPSLVSRHVPSAPSRILDAPDLLDDYYLNLLSWSDTNVLAVALAQTVYLWNAGTGEIDELMSFEGGGGSSGSNTSAAADTYVSSLSWVQEGGQHLAIGTSTGQTLLYDASTSKQLRSMDGHADRVSSMSWNAHVLSTGGRDAAVVNHDVRAQGHAQSRLKGHGAGEVCGLSWSPDGKTLASGGNDNRLCLWDASASATNQKVSGGAGKGDEAKRERARAKRKPPPTRIRRRIAKRLITTRALHQHAHHHPGRKYEKLHFRH